MPAVDQALQLIARERQRDPLAPVTVIVPSHAAAIQLRRRLAEHGPFAGVRFETLPRVAELLAAGELAAAGRSPLARPIGDYAAAQVAHEAGAALASVRDLPGFARVLRQTFRRLRRGGLRRGEDAPVQLGTGLLGEVVRLYGRFRRLTAEFYDEEDLLDAAAAVIAGKPPRLVDELGSVCVVPPGALSAGADRLLTALRRAVRSFTALDETASSPEMRFVLAPDPASEAREVVREVIHALEGGLGVHEVAVFHGADPAYRALLGQAFAVAGIPAVALPGTPLHETPAGRGVLALAGLPSLDYARTATLDFLGLAPLRDRLPVEGGSVAAVPAAWRRLAREAGVTHGVERWSGGLEALIAEREAALAEPGDLSEGRRLRYEADRTQASDLRAFIEALVRRLEPLRPPQAAASFVEAFKRIVQDYLRPDAEALAEVLAEIEQLGTIDAIGGRFSLEGFAAALRANLEVAFVRERQLGDGVLVADYRIAAGLSFRRAVLCGAYEGVFPAGVEAETLVDDRVWASLRALLPFVEDGELRLERSRAAAGRAVAAATEVLTWTAPLQAANAGREHYPSQLMVGAARGRETSLTGASELRRAPERAWLRRPPSPLAALLTGPIVDLAELRLRETLRARQAGRAPRADHPLRPALELLRARRGDGFSEFDGNLAALAGDVLVPRSTVSPTSLESYGVCGFRYFLGSVLRLRPAEEPEDRDTLDPAERGSIVHQTLEAFFRHQQGLERPRPGEAWTEDDRRLLLSMLDERFYAARELGRTGLDVYAEHDRRSLHADLVAFLEHDSAFRLETGAVPRDFELRIPETEVAGLRLAGIVDRVDRTPDGRQAWVIDYKTGRADGFEKVGAAEDPLIGGTKLQLPVYLAAAAGAEKAWALYWFISRRGDFRRVPFDNSPSNRRRFEATLTAVLDGVRSGAFPAVPGEEDEYYGGFAHCRYCDFDRVCSRRRDDELAAKSGDEALRPWFSVGETARGGAT